MATGRADVFSMGEHAKLFAAHILSGRIIYLGQGEYFFSDKAFDSL